jgi:hypothetical protein
MSKEILKYNIDTLTGGTWFTSATFQVIEMTCTNEYHPQEIRSRQVFKGSILDCECYIRLVKNDYIV